MSSTSPTAIAESSPPTRRLALIGPPNAGKTTLFNRLCGERARTANFPGSTVEARVGRVRDATGPIDLIDLPGQYGLDLDRPESHLCRDLLRGGGDDVTRPDGVVIVADATNLVHHLAIAVEVLAVGRPAVVVLTMVDRARRGGLSIDVERFEAELGCPVVAVNARGGEGTGSLPAVLDRARPVSVDLPDPADRAAAHAWAEAILERAVGGPDAAEPRSDTLTDRLDVAFTHPVLGVVTFLVVMAGLFFTIFSLASVPMDGIEWLFGVAGEAVASVLPAGWLRDLLVDGIIGGVAGTVVFLPQICLLFFLVSLLEDTGYLARAAFVMDRIMRRFGLPGQAFVPMLSAHACAIPAIISTRLIPDHRDRLATILVAPFLSCAARLPVYVLLIGLLFGDDPVIGGLAFAGCYALGGVVALLSARLVRTTLLRGPSRPMVLELPAYRLPSLRTAVVTAADQGVMFLRKAGTVIVAICVVLWWLSAFPTVEPPAAAVEMRERAAVIETTDAAEATAQAESLRTEADRIEGRHAAERSYVGRLGHLVEPVLEPVGYDWQLSIGVLSSLLAREVFVSTMSIVISGEEVEDTGAVIERIASARRDDGTPMLTTATSASLLIYYVLAMQCLPTLAVTRREAGGWHWAALQLVWMTGLAYVLALATYQGLRALGVS